MYYLNRPASSGVFVERRRRRSSSGLACGARADDASPDSDLNRLVMDYLVIEGYKSAAEEFSQEAGVVTPVDFDSIESRMNIREALQRGDVQDAITRVNDLNPEVSLCFFILFPHGRPARETRSRAVSGRRRRIKPLHAPLSVPTGSMMMMQHQNFSLQYDAHSLFCSLVLSRLRIRDADGRGRTGGALMADPGHESGAVFPFAAAEADRIYPARGRCCGATVRAGGASASRGGEAGVPV